MQIIWLERPRRASQRSAKRATAIEHGRLSSSAASCSEEADVGFVDAAGAVTGFASAGLRIIPARAARG